MSQPSERGLRQRAEQITQIARLPGFDVLVAEADKRRERDRVALLRLLDSDMTASALQRQADYFRGFSEGMRYVTTSMPLGAARRLQRSETQEPESAEVDYWEVSRG